MLLSISNLRMRQLTRHSPLITRHFFFLLACLMLLCTRPLLALDPSLDISQYAHTAWRVRDGFTQGGIWAIAQTPDGYLWLGSDFGLYRFDGVRAIPWESPARDQLPSSSVSSLMVSRDGKLWIGTRKGLASLKDGQLTTYSAFAGRRIESLLEDQQGTIWAGECPRCAGESVLDGRLCAIRHGTVECHSGFGFGILSLYEDTKGNLWAGSLGGFWRWSPGPPRFYRVGTQQHVVESFAEDPDGALLIAVSRIGIYRFTGTIPQQQNAFPSLHEGRAFYRMLKDRDGALWIALNGGGLLHVNQGRTDAFTARDGLSGDGVSALFQDREGNIWVATIDGLDRFRNFAIPTWSVRQGLPFSPGSAVLAASDGSIWTGNANGLGRLNHGEVNIYRRRHEPGAPLSNGRVRESIRAHLPEVLDAFLEDHRGRIWLSSSQGGLGYLENHRYHALGPVGTNTLAALAESSNGDLWAMGMGGALFRLHQGEVAEQVPQAAMGRKPGEVCERLASDPSHGGLWISCISGGITYLKDGQVRASHSASDGLGAGVVNDLRFGPRGTLWAATEGGLSRIKDGRIITLASKNGLPCDTVHWSIEDDDHFVWLYMACGLVRIAASGLDTWVSNPKNSVRPTIFDASDGVRTAALPTGAPPQVSKAPDGKIWFVTFDGISVIDPRHLPHNDLPPPVHIEQITADDKAAEISTGMHLPTGVRHLDIDYTALSLVVPEKVRFRVKLEGEDNDWRELVNVRHVEYTNLPPKHYRFLVKACNNSGVWNEEGAALEFVIPPAWYQTNWFRALCVAAFLALLWALYQYRLHQLARQFNMRLEERVSERTRIARDLHDTLLQTFQGLVFRFQAACNHLPDRPEEAREALDSALVSADQALAEGRSSIQELRSELLKESNIEQMLLATGRELASSQNGEHGSPPLRVIVEGTRRAKQAMIREEIYRIARELLRNAYRHAHARSIEAELRYDDEAFVLIVRDDGKGIDPEVLKGRGRAGHWGLRGLYERAEGIGARLDVWSEAGAGTEVRLTVPGAIAYEKSSHGGRFKLFQKTRIYERRP